MKFPSSARFAPGIASVISALLLGYQRLVCSAGLSRPGCCCSGRGSAGRSHARRPLSPPSAAKPITEADISFAAEDLAQEIQQMPAEQRKAFLAHRAD